VNEEQRRAAEEKWSALLRDTKATGGRDAFGDRDYSGGSYFSWGEVEVLFFAEQRFRVRETRRSHIGAAGLSSSVPTPTETRGKWAVTATLDGLLLLTLTGADGSSRIYRLARGDGGALLLDDKPYAWVRFGERPVG
jgi:hypothetical protein